MLGQHTSNSVSLGRELSIFSLLIFLLASTEAHHLISAMHLPDATLAAFFLAGRYLRNRWSYPALFCVNFAMDYYLIHYQGVSNFCFTPSYLGLIAAYGFMWLGGAYSHKVQRVTIPGLITLSLTIAMTTSLAFIISNGSFYWFSGRYPEPNLSEYFQRAIQYYPGYMSLPWFWLIVAAVVELSIRSIRKMSANPELSRTSSLERID